MFRLKKISISLLLLALYSLSVTASVNRPLFPQPDRIGESVFDYAQISQEKGILHLSAEKQLEISVEHQSYDGDSSDESLGIFGTPSETTPLSIERVEQYFRISGAIDLSLSSTDIPYPFHFFF